MDVTAKLNEKELTDAICAYVSDEGFDIKNKKLTVEFTTTRNPKTVNAVVLIEANPDAKSSDQATLTHEQPSDKDELREPTGSKKPKKTGTAKTKKTKENTNVFADSGNTEILPVDNIFGSAPTIDPKDNSMFED